MAESSEDGWVVATVDENGVLLRIRVDGTPVGHVDGVHVDRGTANEVLLRLFGVRYREEAADV